MVVRREAEKATTGAHPSPELSVVMPCLNEADTLATCISKARRAMRENGIDGEVVVADNGSTDGSIRIAEEHGARVERVAKPGYGSALMGGIEAARGRFIIMGDADDSYDFLDIHKFVVGLREGNDLVQGCRLPSGGGQIMPGAMPFLHRVWGNPMLSFLVRKLFKAQIHDVYCGLRGFTRELYDELEQRCEGMEFATEMVVKSSLYGYKIAEVPVVLHPDGRVKHAPHLRTFRDGWRTVRLLILYSPRWLYLLPSLLLIALGALGYGLVYTRTTVAGAILDAHALIVSSLLLIMGYQTLLFGAFTKVFAIGEHMLPRDWKIERLFRVFTLERGLLAGTATFLGGLACVGWAVETWRTAGFGPLDYSATMRIVVPGVTACIIGFQTFLGSFFMSILGMKRK